MLWTFLHAIVLWVGVAFVFRSDWVDALACLLQQNGLAQWIAQGFLAVVAHYLISTVVVLPILVMVYLNQRLFRYDAPAEQASQEEIGVVVEDAAGKLYLLGVLAGLIQFVPICVHRHLSSAIGMALRGV